MSKTEIWDKHADIDPRFTKPITGKPYKGTSPNAQHVIWCLTDLFGPVGQGFGWRVLAEGWQPMGDELLHWCRIEFWHTEQSNTWQEYGQTMAIRQTRNGMMNDEDAPKKSLTDAIVKAASHLGVAANIFLGRWDDQKYVAEVAREFSGSPNEMLALRDRMLAAIAKTADVAALAKLENHERFGRELDRLREADPPKANEVTAALARRQMDLERENAA